MDSSCGFVVNLHNSKKRQILITGSSAGIGLGIAQCFDENQDEVILTGRTSNSLIQAVQKLKNSSHFFVGDLTLATDIEKIEKQYPDIDVLICNLGSGKSVPVGDENINEWRRVFEINFFSTVQIIEKYKNKLIEKKGSIVCISSICGNSALGAPIAYSVAKSALNAYVNNMSRHFGAHGVRMNIISPGNIMFDGSTWQHKQNANPEMIQNILNNEVPLKTFGTPDDIGHMCVYLASEKSKFITGSQFVIDGGQQKNI
jgi:3-oxoacyl-[acyl-carrier protein] reductase